MRSVSQQIFSLLIVVGFGVAQEPAAAVRASDELGNPKIPQTRLAVQSSVEVPLVFNASFTAYPTCGSDGAMYGRFLSGGEAGELTAISGDGTRTTFERNKMIDVNSPSERAHFVSGSDVYILVRSVINKGDRRKMRLPDGSVQTFPVVEDGGTFIARYKRDGTYVGAIKFDPPLQPMQLGVFPNGDFLIAGTTKNRQETRIAMFRSNGQFIKFIELKGDIRLRDEENPDDKDPAALPQSGKRFYEGFGMAMQLSTIVSDGPNLLLVRKVAGMPVFSISPGGEVTRVPVKGPAGFTLWKLETTPQGWIAVFMHRISDARGMEYRMMAIDRETGEPTQEFVYERRPGTLACTDGREFTFLVNENDKFKIVKLAPVR